MSKMSWLDANTLAEKDEFEHRLKDCQRVCGSIMTKRPGARAGGKGQTVEDVD